MKIRIIRPFRDMELNRYVIINEEYNVTDERYKQLKERVPTFFEVIEEEKKTEEVIEQPIEEIKTVEETATIEFEEPITYTIPKKKKR